MQTDREMPKYKSHKEVWALKIKAIVRDGDDEKLLGAPIVVSKGGAVILPEEEGYAPFTVGEPYLTKHNPHVGGYFVVYKDGYKSFSPAEVFEEGNTLIVETTFLERLVAEEKELVEKMTKLAKIDFSEVGTYQRELLRLQLDAMNMYYQVLKMRIKDLYSIAARPEFQGTGKDGIEAIEEESNSIQKPVFCKPFEDYKALFKVKLVRRYHWSVNDAYWYDHAELIDCFNAGMNVEDAYCKIFDVEPEIKDAHGDGKIGRE